MSKINKAILNIENLRQTAQKDQWVNRIHPLVKLFLTIFYIAIVVSMNKYHLLGTLVLAIYPVFIFIVGEVSFKDALRRLRIVLPLVCIVGILNPFFDRTIVTYVNLGFATSKYPDGMLAVSGGFVSFFSLMIKGVLTVFASYLLIATTTIEDICYSLRKIHVPKVIVTQVLLIYRYITLLLSEVNKITQAYELRAPGQKGVAFKAWGSLVGRLLLRSMDRADEVYESMCLRGFKGDFDITRQWYGESNKNTFIGDLSFAIIWTGLILVLKLVPVSYIIGSLFI
ncbi:MAG: cobalt ECF transporter T component CbiQ [Lachnospiraceae bacterium]|nr:cobalt ECF transporter T component CbiQ [Lachnospiraceae bacterium]